MKMRIIIAISLLGGLFSGRLLAGGISVSREVPYPSAFEIKTSPDGRFVYAVPTAFKTRKVGTSLQILSVGVVYPTNRRTRQGHPVVQLMLGDGRKLSTAAGRFVKFQGEAFQAVGWQGNHYVLRSPKTRNVIYFQKS